MNEQLWIPSKGHWAEYKDFMGHKRVHESAAVWTIYHAIDSETADPFQAYQATRYVDTAIPHIPVRAEGLKDEPFETISTTNWLPYSWSINNVAFASDAHLVGLLAGPDAMMRAFKLLKSSVLDGMYPGGSPGNFGQVSFMMRHAVSVTGFRRSHRSCLTCFDSRTLRHCSRLVE